MRKNFGSKPYLFPQPVLIIAAYDEEGKPNAMNASWGMVNDEHQLTLILRPQRKTTKNILKRKDFTVSFCDAKNVVVADYVGVVTAEDDPHKMEKTGWHMTKSEFVDAPLIDELPVAMECRLISYDDETHRMVAEIVNVCADESVLGEDGKVDYARMDPLCCEPIHMTYMTLGKQVGRVYRDGLKLK